MHTIIRHIKGDLAQGFILNSDLTLEPCYIAKSGRHFAHGKTAHEAYKSALDKSILNEPVEDRIDRFLADHKVSISYSARDLFDWHHRLTGSCEMGRKAFCRDKGIDVDKDSFTIEEFVKITCHAYGSEVICKLADKLGIQLS
ncbi:MAG: hypothetical protein NC209_04075 [Alistipes sp.]|nr:hypothetical protein [Alistipes sp.]